MKNRLNHFLSLLALVGFLFVAIYCGPIPEGECDDPRNIELEWTGETNQFSTVTIRIIDRITMEPIPNITVDALWSAYYIEAYANCDNGLMQAWPLQAVNYVTDVNGRIQTPVVWVSRDLKDRLIGQLHIADDNEVYVPRETFIRIEQNTNTMSFTIPLLKFETL
jgi:hypothetical protein